jgi:AraC-like DNA-binding protein
MKKPASFTQDLQILGEKTQYQVIRAECSDQRDWMQTGPLCPALSHHHIAHCGLMQAEAPFEIVRNDQSGTFLLVCIDGEGVILADGEWKIIKKGQACLLPPFVMNALKCLPGKSWHFAWVRYRENRESRPIVSSISPVTGSCDPLTIKAVLEGLHAECLGENSLSAVHHWSELVQHYVMRFAQPHRSDDRLWRVWQRVEADLTRQWTVDELAEIACVSNEHFRRLCKKELGRTPVQQLVHIRLHHARNLIIGSDEKIATISNKVGFDSVFTFSNTFHKWIGSRPTDFRKK